jgi:hypothetical protein
MVKNDELLNGASALFREKLTTVILEENVLKNWEKANGFNFQKLTHERRNSNF